MRTKTTTAAALIGALVVLPNVDPANTAGATTLAARTDESRASVAPAPGAKGGVAIAQRDGTPGNPPSTATGRAVDRAQGQTPRADGTPGNPPGTAVGRATDRALGTDTTGANPGRTAPSR
jgi:hypothetical protein